MLDKVPGTVAALLAALMALAALTSAAMVPSASVAPAAELAAELASSMTLVA